MDADSWFTAWFEFDLVWECVCELSCLASIDMSEYVYNSVYFQLLSFSFHMVFKLSNIFM